MKVLELPPNLVRAHLIFQKMSHYPAYFREMREVFLWVIEEKGLATEHELKSMAQ